MAQTGTITIDGKKYAIASLSETAKVQISNLRIVDSQIQQLQQQLAIAQTARSAYVSILQMELPKAANA